jgi:ribosomal protein S18
MAKESKKEEVKGEEKPIEEMTVKELRGVAKGIPDITGVSSMKKEQLFEAIKKAKEEAGKKEEAPAQEAVTEEVAQEEVPVEEKAEEEESEQIEAKEKEAEVKEPEAIGEEEKPLDKMTATELREIAREIPDIEGAHAMKKEQLLEAIKKARGVEEEAPGEKKEKKGAESEAIIRDLKHQILLLKQEKQAARDAKDRKKLGVLRRRINRLKKRTRKVAQAA